MPLTLSSGAFAPGGLIPARYTCDGANISPPLAWSGLPQGTRSLVLVLEDPDAPSGPFRHWIAFDIPADRTGLDEGYGRERLARAFREAISDAGQIGYSGPCPPRNHGVHNYHFRLWALAEAVLPLGPSPGGVEVVKAAEPLILGQAVLIGGYGR